MSKKDQQLEDFENEDLGENIRASESSKVVRKSRPTSILLDDELIASLREKATKRGIGYQTMLKIIVREHLDDY